MSYLQYQGNSIKHFFEQDGVPPHLGLTSEKVSGRKFSTLMEWTNLLAS
jgi:hypothetical protein